mmetsp:Transcript_15191/g.43446  ORF Transcript_15191/g.43446 Transcript_15191/m.43446 type:complete len:577 (+) Transcript_15191:285-2015(+)
MGDPTPQVVRAVPAARHVLAPGFALLEFSGPRLRFCEHMRGQAGQARHVVPERCRAEPRQEAVQEGGLLRPLVHLRRHVEGGDAGRQRCLLRHGVVMRREEGQALHVAHELVEHCGRDGRTIVGRSAPAQLVKHRQRARGRVLEDCGRLLQFHEQCALPLEDRVVGAYSCEDSVDRAQTEPRCIDATTELCHYHGDARLPQDSRLTAHVRAGHNDDAGHVSCVKHGVVRHEGRAHLGGGDRVPALPQLEGPPGCCASALRAIRSIDELRPAAAARQVPGRRGQRQQRVDLRYAAHGRPEGRLVGMELLEEPGEEGEDAVLPLVLEEVQLGEESLDARRMEPHLLLGACRDVHTREERLRERPQVGLHLVAETRQPVHEDEAGAAEPCPETRELLLQLPNDAPDLPAHVVMPRVRAVRRAVLHPAVLGVRLLDDAAAEPRDGAFELREAAACGPGPGDLGEPRRQGQLLREARGDHLEGVLVGLEQALEVAQALRRDVLVQHGMALRLQGEAPDAGGVPLQVDGDFLQTALELLRQVRVVQEELDSVMSRPDLTNVVQRGAEPLLQEPEAARGASVV